MNFNKYVDFKAIPFSEYVETLISMSPIPLDSDDEDSTASFYLDARGMNFIGHFNEIYPQFANGHDFERVLVLENDEKERILIFDMLVRKLEVICNPDDKEALQSFIDERQAEIKQYYQDLTDYQERCKKQIDGTALPNDLKEYDVHFNLKGQFRVSAVSEEEARLSGNKILNKKFVYPHSSPHMYYSEREHVTEIKNPFEQ